MILRGFAVEVVRDCGAAFCYLAKGVGEVVYFFDCVVEPEADAHEAGEVGAVAASDTGGVFGELFIVEFQQLMDIGVGAEATVADADSVFVAENCGEEAMVHLFAENRDDSDAVVGDGAVGVAVDADAGDLR